MADSSTNVTYGLSDFDLNFQKSFHSTCKELRTLTLANIEFYQRGKSSIYARYYAAFRILFERVQSIEPVVDSLVPDLAQFDYSPEVHGNGYRSFISLVDRCCIHLLQLCRHINVNKLSLLFRSAYYCKELESYVEALSQLWACLHYLQQLMAFTKDGHLFVDDNQSLADELLLEVEMLNVDCFYGRCLGFQFYESIQKILQGVLVAMASFSECYQETSQVFQLASSILNSGKYVVDQDLRAKQVVNVTRTADIRFCKAFWSIPDSRILHQLRSFTFPYVEVSQIISLDAENFELPLEGSSETVTITPPCAHTGPGPILARLISATARVGQQIQESPQRRFKNSASGKKSERQPLSPGLLFHCHGGGFVAQSSQSHENYLRHWAQQLQVPIFSVDYALAPGQPFPRALEECFYAYSWALKNPEKLGWTGERVCFAGDSAGANLVISTALRAVSYGIRVPDGITAVYPVVLIQYTPSPSRLLSMIDPLLPVGILTRCLAAYAGIADKFSSALAQPIFCNPGRFETWEVIGSEDVTSPSSANQTTDYIGDVDRAQNMGIVDEDSDLRRNPNDDRSAENESKVPDKSESVLGQNSYECVSTPEECPTIISPGSSDDFVICDVEDCEQEENKGIPNDKTREISSVPSFAVGNDIDMLEFHSDAFDNDSVEMLEIDEGKFHKHKTNFSTVTKPFDVSTSQSDLQENKKQTVKTECGTSISVGMETNSSHLTLGTEKMVSNIESQGVDDNIYGCAMVNDNRSVANWCIEDQESVKDMDSALCRSIEDIDMACQGACDVDVSRLEKFATKTYSNRRLSDVSCCSCHSIEEKGPSDWLYFTSDEEQLLSNDNPGLKSKVTKSDAKVLHQTSVSDNSDSGIHSDGCNNSNKDECCHCSERSGKVVKTELCESITKREDCRKDFSRAASEDSSVDQIKSGMGRPLLDLPIHPKQGMSRSHTSPGQMSERGNFQKSLSTCDVKSLDSPLSDDERFGSRSQGLLLTDITGSRTFVPKLFSVQRKIAQSPIQLFRRLPIVKNPYMSPILAPDVLLKGLPDTHIVASQFDPLLDDSVMFAKKLRSLQKNVDLHIVDSLPHGFLSFSDSSPEAKQAANTCLNKIKLVLGID